MINPKNLLNMIATEAFEDNVDPAPIGFPNLAAHEERKPEFRERAIEIMRAELADAGIETFIYDGDAPNSEVPGNVFGTLAFWTFKRAWRYWIAKGPGLPVEVAERLHTAHGQEARVAGHCGCPSPRDWYKGFGVPDYHVDTQAGLNALADAIRSVYDPKKDPNAQPYCGSEPGRDYRRKKEAPDAQ